MSAIMFLGLAGLAGTALAVSHAKSANKADPSPSPAADGSPSPTAPATGEYGGIQEGVIVDPAHPRSTVNVQNDGLGPTTGPDGSGGAEPSSGGGETGGGPGTPGLGMDVAPSNPTSTPVLHAEGVLDTNPKSYGQAVYGTAAGAGKHLDARALLEWGPVTGAVW